MYKWRVAERVEMISWTYRIFIIPNTYSIKQYNIDKEKGMI